DSTIGLHDMVVADINGDGRPDLVDQISKDWSSGNHQLSYFTTVNSLFDTEQTITVEAKTRALSPNLSAQQFGDFNGDGLTDFVASISDVTLSYTVFISEQAQDGSITMVELADAEFTAGLNEILVADINSDGLSDLVFNGALWSDLSEVKWRYRLSTGDGLAGVADVGLVSGYRDTSDYSNFQFGDINVDGQLDFVYYKSSVDRWYYLPFSDDDFAAVQSMSIPAGVRGELEREDVSFIDYNGNGYADLLYFDSDDKRIVKYPDENTEPKAKIEKIDNGRGMITDIVYQPLTNANVYSRGIGANALDWGNGSAVLDVISPTQVVSSVSSSAPSYNGNEQYLAAAQVEVNYFYTGLRLQAGGRGNLGFAAIKSTDVQSGIETVTQYRQDFPYAGLPTMTTQTLGEQTLSHATNTYVSTPMMLNGGTVYFPYLDTSPEN
ncbi:MAG: hypothetical protein MJK04_21235, partial [Psychrosphaera sp.]|nr:hypothetical protein [Psychrosphaera sp.]